MLVETTRKLLSSIVIRRIQNAWEKFPILSPGHNGSLRRLGTDTALLVFINALEEAAENGTDIFASTWDITKAFDSATKELLKLAWIRLGVPLDIAVWLVDMDKVSHTVVRSPWARSVFANSSYSGFTANTNQLQDPAFFHPMRGVAQGDVPSPLNWVAFFDILLRALEYRDPQFKDVMIRDSEGVLHSVSDVAYVDDLMTMVASQEALQHTADIVSGFCAIFGLTMVPEKLRAFLQQWGALGEMPLIRG
jgi:hypothetical protein